MRQLTVYIAHRELYFQQVFAGIMREVTAAKGWRVHAPTHFDIRAELGRSPAQGDAMILSLTPACHNLARALHVPFVDVAFEHDGHLICPHVMPDHAAAGRLVAEHFLNCGYKAFGFIGSAQQPPPFWVRARYQGFREALQNAQHHCITYAMDEQGSPDVFGAHDRHFAAWVAALPEPVALLLASTEQAATVLDACRSRGLSIPEHVALAGIGNEDALCRALQPQLSNVELDGYSAVRYAA